MNKDMKNIELKQGFITVSYTHEVNGETFDEQDVVEVTPEWAAWIMRHLRHKFEAAHRGAACGPMNRALYGAHPEDLPPLTEKDWHPEHGTPLN